MIKIVLFTKGEKLADMEVEVAPREGETIILDCNLVFKIIEVVHQLSARARRNAVKAVKD